MDILVCHECKKQETIEDNIDCSDWFIDPGAQKKELFHICGDCRKQNAQSF